MTYQSADISVEDGNPIEYYLFTAGAIRERFTNAHEEKTFLLEQYLPVEVQRSQPRVNQDEPGSSVEITLTLTDPNSREFADNWISSAPEVSRYKVTIYRQMVDDGGAITYWIGFVSSARYNEKGLKLTILCKSLDNLFTLQGPRKNWGTVCNHKHYGNECGLAVNDFDFTTTVASIDASGLVYTLTDTVPAPVVRWEGGIMTRPGRFESRMLVLRSGNDVTVQYPIPEIAVGDTVNISEGCAHDTVDCKAFPNSNNTSNTNLENFGGTPNTPNQNPFSKRLDLPLT